MTDGQTYENITTVMITQTEKNVSKSRKFLKEKKTKREREREKNNNW